MSVPVEPVHEKVVKMSVSAKVIPLLYTSQLCDDVKLSLVTQCGELVSLPTLTSSSQELFKTSLFRDYSVLSESDYVWEAMADDGTYTVLSPEVDKKVKEAHQVAIQNGLLFGQFEHEGRNCTVDFQSCQLSEGSTPVVRHIRHSSPYWCYNVPETGFLRHEDKDSMLIEEAFRFGGMHTTMGGTQYMFMFSTDKCYQVDTKTLEMVEIKRYPPVTMNPCEIQVQLAVEGNPESVPTVQRQLTELSEYRKELKFSFQANDKTNHILVHQIANVTRSYCVSASLSLVGNQLTTTIYGVEWYVDKLSLVLHELNTALQAQITSLAIHDSPVEWDPQTTQCELKVVRDSGELSRVLGQMRESLNVEIVKLERVQNQPLWEKYALEKRQMSERNHGVVNEKYLFHGTRKNPPEKVALDIKGIDFRCSRSDGRLMWGTGAYFAEKASYSDTYAYQMQDGTGIRQMILVRVLTGNSCMYPRADRTTSTLTKPPPLLKWTSHGASVQLYDTVNGHTNGSQVYVVYDHDKSYPAYIISYRTRPVSMRAL